MRSVWYNIFIVSIGMAIPTVYIWNIRKENFPTRESGFYNEYRICFGIIYSAVGLGIHLFYNKGDDLQTNLNDNLGLAMDICALGISVGNNHLFGAFEVGNMTTFTFPRMSFIGETFRMTQTSPFSKLLRISIGYRF